jgi:hypothetical protein
MRTIVAALVASLLTACSWRLEAADPASDAPEARVFVGGGFKDAPSYRDALKVWQSAEDVNAWIGAKFQYDMSRAMQLSETQRQRNGRMSILKPEEFFVAPSGVCVDVSRFAVETLRAIDPVARPTYVMIEFEPASIGGNTLRRHWVASFERDGRYYFFADSNRPGHISGPYVSTQAFIAEYARYRGRQIMSYSEMEPYERKAPTLAVKQVRGERP